MLLVLDQLVLELLLQVNVLVAGVREPVDCVHDEIEAVELVERRHVERRGDGAFFLVTADVNVCGDWSGDKPAGWINHW